MHADAPAALYEPWAQAVAPTASVAPLAAIVYVPASQKYPGGQSEQVVAPFAMYLPEPHVTDVFFNFGHVVPPTHS